MLRTIFYLVVIIHITLQGCQEKTQDTPISYIESLKTCIPDTVLMITMENDTTRFFQLSTDCVVGAQLPTVEALTMDSIKIDSAYFSNKITVINFWFIGCHPCEAEMPGFNKLVEKYSGQSVQFLAISRNSPKDVADFLIEDPFDFSHVAYGEPLIVKNFQSRWGYPVTMVSDQNQKIIYASSGGKDDSTAVEEIQKALIPVIDSALKL